MGGFMSIKSEKDKGSTFTIVIDQKIVHDSKGNEYNKYLFNKKKILLVSDKKSTLDKIKYLIRNFNAEVLTVMYGQDCVERVKNKESFDLILLEDEMQPDSALTTLKNLESLNNFKVPTVVMLGKNKEKIKDYYLDDGFDDYLLKDNIEEETKRILKKYI
jgi:CheY-like chemotaxis protein